MNKKILTVLLCVVCLCAFPLFTKADDDIDLIIEQELGLFDFSSWDYADDEVNINARDMVEGFVKGREKADVYTVTDYVLLKIKSLILGRLPMILILFAASLASGLCSSLVPDDGSPELHGMITFISCAVCASTVAAVFIGVMKESAEAVNRAVTFTECATPVLALIMTASGRGATEAVFSPAMSFLTGAAAGAVRSFIMPAVLCAFVFALVNALSTKSRAGKLFSLSKSVFKWACGIVTVVFTGALSVYGIGARAHDSLTVKTAKYVIDKAIPGAGGLISGTADTILEAMGAVRAAAGTVFIIIAVIIASRALFDILAVIISLRLASALSDTVCDARIPALLSDTADVAGLLFAAVAAVNAMLIIAVGLCTVILV